MIFVTVGTHEQQFNRLVKKIDTLVAKKIIKEEVFIQTGFSSYEPKHCKWSQWLSFSDMEKKISEAHIIITHGGPSSFIMPLQLGKVPIVVPRAREFDEHVNNHQVTFVKFVADKKKNIIPIYDVNDLELAIVNYDKISSEMNRDFGSNNEKFVENFEKIVNAMFK